MARKTKVRPSTRNRLQHQKRQRWRKSRIKQQGGKCYYCGLEFREDLKWFRSTLDHLIPLSQGGEDHYENTVAACYRCNQDKRSQTAEEFQKQAA